MKIKYIIITIISLITFKVNAVTIQNSFLCLHKGNILGYYLNREFSYSISSGQPWKGFQLYAEDGHQCINVVAGRHRTSAPKDWLVLSLKYFSDINFPSYYMQSIPEGMNDFPDELNFAAVGKLRFTLDAYPSSQYSCENVHIAQASSKTLGIGYNYFLIFNNNNTSTAKFLECFDDSHQKWVKFAIKANGYSLQLDPIN